MLRDILRINVFLSFLHLIIMEKSGIDGLFWLESKYYNLETVNVISRHVGCSIPIYIAVESKY